VILASSRSPSNHTANYVVKSKVIKQRNVAVTAMLTVLTLSYNTGFQSLIALKFQMIAKKTAKNIRDIFLAHPVYRVAQKSKPLSRIIIKSY